MELYHTGRQIIKSPDINYGRKNADFGAGFYLSNSLDFAGRWARERETGSTFINRYELDLAGLNAVRFSRDKSWFKYIFNNRNDIKICIPKQMLSSALLRMIPYMILTALLPAV